MFSLFKPFSWKLGDMWQRFICLCLLFAISFNALGATLTAGAQNLFSVPVVEAASSKAEPRYGLVAILVDKNLLNDPNNYPGLSEEYDDVDNETVKDRVQRYAEDVQKKNPYTKATIFSIDTSLQGAPELASTLEKLYFDGDSSDENAKLMGVVLVGDVPLPVVNKNGNRFLSMLPYTDFHEKSYIYNPKTDDFEYDNRSVFPRVEVWHGVIKAPVEAKNDFEKANNMALYFDKNHLFQIGNADFANFDKSLLLSDLYHERELMNTGLFEYYKLFEKEAENLTYLRANKHWAEELYAKFSGDLKKEGDAVLQDEYKQFLDDTKGLFANMPDIQSKQAVIDKYHLPYIKLFNSYLSRINDWIGFTGRYAPEDAQSIVELISTKDQYNVEYLHQVNTALENKLDDLVKKSLQKYIPLISHSALNGGIVVRVKTTVPDGDDSDTNPDIIEIDEHLKFTHKVRSAEDVDAGGALADQFNYDSPLFVFLNSSLILYAKDIWPKAFTQVTYSPLPEGEVDAQLEADINDLKNQADDLAAEGKIDHSKKVLALLEDKKNAKKIQATLEAPEAADRLYINGKPAKDIEGPLDCSLYRGSSLLTVNNRLYNLQTAGKNLFLGVSSKPVFEYSGYNYGVYVNSVIPGSPAEKAGIKQGDLILEFNSQVLNKDFGDGERFMLDDILTQLNPDKETQASVKFFSKESKKEVGPVTVTLENINAAKWSNGCYGTNGIAINGKDNAGKCIGELSKVPLFDAAAGKEISEDQLPFGEDVDEAHIRSCYDIFYNEEPRYALIADWEANFSKQPFVKLIEDFFTFNSDEPKKYLNPLAKFTPDLAGTSATDSNYHPVAKDIILYDKNGFSLTFVDLLNHAGAFDGIDNDVDGEVDEVDENDIKYAVDSNNWSEIGERVLSRDGTFRFYMPEVKGDVEIKIAPNVVKWISSMIPHKDPLNETIGSQARAMSTESLPIDEDRYLAFLDKNGVMQKLDYANLFDSTSYQDFQVRLYKLAKQIAAIPGSEKLVPQGATYDTTEAVYRELLLVIDPNAFLDDSTEGASKIDQYTKTEIGQQVMTSTFKDKLEDALIWKTLGIDDKHDYILSTYLNPKKDAYVAEKNGYEALYLVSDGEHDFSSFSFYGDYPAAKLDVTLPTAAEIEAGVDTGTAPEGTEASVGDLLEDSEAEAASGNQAIPLLDWFPEILAWLQETISSVTQVASADFSLGMGASCALGDAPDIIEAILTETEEETAKEGVVASLQIKVDKGTLRADGSDTAIMVVKALDKNGHHLVNESKTEVELVVAPEAQTQASFPYKVSKIVNGVATFKIVATRNAGDINIQAATTNTSQRFLSNVAQIKVTGKNLALGGSNSILAGSSDPLPINASLLDENGLVISDENEGEVKFEVTDNSTLASLEKDSAPVAKGETASSIKAGTKAGVLKLKATTSSKYPQIEKDIYVMPAELVAIKIVPSSTVIKSGGVSYTPVQVRMEDKFGNVKNDNMYQVTIWHDGPGEFKNIEDEDPNQGGIQITTSDGVVNFVMSSTAGAGQIIVHASTFERDPTGESEDKATYNNASIWSRNDLYLSAVSNTAELKADGSSKALITLSINDAAGVVKQANLPIGFSVSQQSLLSFDSTTPTVLQFGQAFTSVKSGLTSGKVEVIANVPGFESISVPLKIKPLEPYKVQFVKPENVLVSDNISSMEIEARVLDKNGNFIDEDSSTNVFFGISEATKQVAEFLTDTSLLAQNGKATATLKSTYFSGPIRLQAKGKGLKVGDNIEISSEKRILSSTFKNSNAKTLFASLLGNAFGDVTQKNSLSSAMLFSGYTEAISATTTPMEQKKILFTLGANGQVQTFDSLGLKAVYSSSGNNVSSDKVSLLDARDGSILAETSVVLPNTGFVKLPNQTQTTGGKTPGVYLESLIDNQNFTVVEDGGDALIRFKGIPHLKITSKGQIVVLEGKYTVTPLLEDQAFLTFNISSATQSIAHVKIIPSVSNDAIVVDDNYDFSIGSPIGAYLIKRNSSSKYQLKEFFTGNSDLSRRGLAWYDMDQFPESKQVLGGPHTSLEGAFEKNGVGFVGQNKHMLLFFAGNSVGESFMPYASETGIVLGDPTVKLKVEGVSNGFSADLGQSIYTNNKNIKSLEKIDYNSDGVDDVLMSFEDGKVHLLEGVFGNPDKPFNDKGLLLDITNGINSLTVGDINNDKQDDIIVATKESCRQGETCVYIFENFNGHFLQKNAGLNLEEKVSDLKIADLNKDGYGDLVAADLNRAVLAFYGSKTGLSTNSKYIGGLEATAQEGVNTAYQTFISYTRTDEESKNILASYGFDPFVPLTLPSNNPADGAGKDQPLSAANQNAVAQLASVNIPGVTVTPAPVYGKKIYQFLPLTRDLRFDTSLKKVKDSNGGDVKSGDQLQYSITLTNDGNQVVNASILDYVPETFTLDKNTIACEGCNVKLDVIETGMSSRPYLLTGINVAAGQNVKITYSVKAATFPPLKLIIGNNFEEYPQDDYLDILAHPEEQPENHVIYYSAKEGAEVNYLEKYPDVPEGGATKMQDPVAAANQDVGFNKPSLENDKNGNGTPDNYEGFNEDTSSSVISALLPNTEKQDEVHSYTTGAKDGDLDSIPDVLDAMNGALDAVNGQLEGVAAGIEAAMAALKCSGGCIPMPVNMTLHLPFPVTGKVNAFGVPAGYIPGIPIFAITKPSTLAPPVINTIVWPAGNPFYFESVFRIYASPTLTGGLGTAFCVGDYPWTVVSQGNSCFIIAVPVLQALGVCKALTDGISGAINSMKTAVMSGVGSGLSVISSLGSNPATGSNQVQATGFSMGPIPISASVAANVRIPGFPSVIINWFDRQTEEIVDKLMDLPDIYLILPEPRSLLGGAVTPTQEWKDVSDLSGFLAYINSIPLVQLEQKEVAIKIPWMYEDQIEKTIREYEQWIENFKKDWERFKKTLDCDPDAYDSICSKLSLDVDSILGKMERNIQMLEEYRELPKKLLKFRNLETQYVNQLVCYLDTIINYTGGYIKKQGDRVAAWIRAIDTVKKTFQDWKVIIDIALTYAASCDSCKTDRFSLLELLLKLLVVIPDPPILEMPKWPDIVIDVSQIQTGLKLVIPDFVFVPEPLILPPPPKFQFPDVLLPNVNIKVSLPSIPSLPEIPEIRLPDLPGLPPLPLPSLPDIPPPPEIPELPKPILALAANFKTLFRIFCLVKLGLLPLPETEVSTEFETLTQRSLSPLLPSPFDMSLNFQLPPFSYSYVNQIEVVAKLNFQLDVSIIYDAVANAADILNTYTSYGVNYTNEQVTKYGSMLDDYVIDAGDIQIPDVNLNINPAEDNSKALQDALSSFMNDQNNDLQKNLVAYNEEVEKFNKYAKSVPDKIIVKATSTTLDASHPIFKNSVDDIKRSMLASDLDQYAPSDLVAYRSQLIAYHDSLTEGTNSLYNAVDSKEFMSLLADNSFRLGERSAPLPTFKASTENPFTQSIKEAGKIKDRIIALQDDSENSDADAAQSSPKGLFIFDPNKNINQNLISYTDELESETHLLYANIDEDDDEDILFSFGGDLYLKRNHTEEPDFDYYSKTPQILELKDLEPAAASVNYLHTTVNSNEMSKIAWDKVSVPNLAAYELEIKYRFPDFGNTSAAGSLAHFMPTGNQEDTVFNRPDHYTYEVIQGDLFVNGQNVTETNVGEIKANNLLQTSEPLDTEIHLTAYDSRGNNLGLIKLGPSTNWVVPSLPNDKNAQIAVDSGEIIFELKNTNTSYLAVGDTIKTSNAKVLVNYGDTGSYLVHANQQFNVPQKNLAPMYVKESSFFAKATINGKPRFTTSEATGTMQEGDIIHMLEPSIVLGKSPDGTELLEVNQQQHSIFVVPQVPKDTIFYVQKGKVEVIRKSGKAGEQKLVDGAMIDFKDFVTVYGGDIALQQSTSQAQTIIATDQTFALYDLSNNDKPEADINLLNGNYYSSMTAVLNDNQRGTSSLTNILAPQSCGDKAPPYINIGETEKSVAIFQSAQVDASSSFDAAGKVVAYYADTDLEKDSDGNGDATDDKDLFSDDPSKNLDVACFKDKEMDNSVFNFGPYSEPGEYKVKVYAIDQSCNFNGQIVTIKVIVPDIYLDPTSARSGELSGHIEPPIANMPFRFIRDRKPPLEGFETDSADDQGFYYTDAAGQFKINDLQNGNIIGVSDDAGNQVADVDPFSGNIDLKDNKYKVEILAARPPDFPTRAAIIDANGDIVASFFVVPDLNNDTALVNEINYENKQVQIQLQTDSDFSIEKLPSSDVKNPGATIIKYLPDNKEIALINSSGNIFALDERITLALTKMQDNKYNVHLIEILFNGDLIADVYLPGQNIDGVMPTIAERDVHKFSVVGSTPSKTQKNSSPFADINEGSNNSETILKLAELGIIDGYNENGEVVFKPDQLIGRAEYTKILLKTLCIEPRAEAYQGPSTFSDIAFDENNIPWYYPFVKESYLQTFINGYVGEKDPETGLNPFKPGNTITRAEAATIILSALNKLGTVNLEGITTGDPWYAPYMEVAQNLGPYLNNPQENSQLFLLTAEEAKDPEKQITRSEFAVMAERVLNINNCFTLDDDNDGMPSQWEKKNSLNPYDAADAKYDDDKDELDNLGEYQNDTNPHNPDTDGGCMMDGPEVKAKFNASSDPLDDDPDFDGLSCTDENNTYKTDPYKADTDSGGVNDGREVLVDKTDPLFGEDDNKGIFDDVKTALAEGVYAIEQSCNSCPCDSSIANKADILTGDDFWAVITALDNYSKIYKKSNSVTINNVP